ncbi:GDSL-type esterase/lipase family protein [Streptomyces sp. UNOC14_S4]|uniref:SGNH/GDSL hydrolase family protein n=1 Tax=Streptomyces sp. UNOC14_S4 TaxID=2872340 RepID=UPI001E2BE221|nr:GDSL-type esterase/lipase family protein [Streptomyces sp. UNOC14_S4]MCC3769263.1 Inducer of phenazine A [Streptomyces sp. UNOC14_S4]
MPSPRAELTPQMAHYTFVLEDQPYIGFFQYGDERTPVYTTDPCGFRVSHCAAGPASVAGPRPPGPVRLLAGSSAVFGVGATGDHATVPSRLGSHWAPDLPWLNFAGQSLNSVQELMLLTLFQHLLPEVTEIVLCSGVNNLVLSRLPEGQQGRHGAFFECGPAPASVPTPAERIARATELTIRHLTGWQRMAQALGARITFVLQPLAPWVREEPSPQEKALFDELDEVSNWRRLHHDIASMEVGRAYAAALREGCAAVGVPFLDLNPALGEATAPGDWLFVDRVHCVDAGYDAVARVLAERLALS